MTRRAALAVLLAALPGVPRAQDDAALARTMAALAAVRERRDRFVEEKTLPGLDAPLPSGGTLRWVAPDALERRTTWPMEERLTVSGGRLSYEMPALGIRRDFALSDQPEMGALLEAIRGTLAGDLAALRRHYGIAFAAGDGNAWTMRLTPLSSRVRGLVERIVITGEGTAVTTVDSEGVASVSRMRITPAP